MAIVPKQFFFTKGIGIHEKDMRAFEEALRDAGVHTCNFIKTSSVIPPGCKLISKEEGIKLLQPGQITFAIMAQSMTMNQDRWSRQVLEWLSQRTRQNMDF